MAFDLTSFEPCVRRFADDWDALALDVTVKLISPNYGKAVTGADFESDTWLATVAVWETGELDLDTARKADGWIVNKHYDVEDVVGLDHVFGELIALVRASRVPADAVTSWF